MKNQPLNIHKRSTPQDYRVVNTALGISMIFIPYFILKHRIDSLQTSYPDPAKLKMHVMGIATTLAFVLINGFFILLYVLEIPMFEKYKANPVS